VGLPLPQSGAGYDGGGGIDDALDLAGVRVGDVRANDGTAVLQNEQRGPELIGRYAGFLREISVGREAIALLDVEEIHQHRGDADSARLLSEDCEHGMTPELKHAVAVLC
jgi:hypothetical protein